MFVGLPARVVAIYADGSVCIRTDPTARPTDPKLDLLDVELIVRGMSEMRVAVGSKVEITVKLKE